MTKEEITEKANELSQYYSEESDYKKTVGYDCAIKMADWLLQNIQIIKLNNVYTHDLLENYRFQCFEEQKNNLLLSLKDYIKMEEELTDYGVIVKMEIKVLK